jgi:hypothetical protein
MRGISIASSLSTKESSALYTKKPHILCTHDFIYTMTEKPTTEKASSQKTPR